MENIYYICFVHSTKFSDSNITIKTEKETFSKDYKYFFNSNNLS